MTFQPQEDDFPPGLERVLNPDARTAWRQIRAYLPAGSYLAGGTAVAIHLRHRQSNDLDFFTTEPLDVDDLNETLERTSLPFVTERASQAAGNLLITLGKTKVEFSNAAMVTMVEPTTDVNGIEVAGLGDLLAMKLSTIAKRRKLRDFEDIRAIEEDGGRRIEEGLALARIRYGLEAESDLIPLVANLARIDECEDDPLVGTDRSALIEFFRRRLPEVIASLSRWDTSVLSEDLAEKVARLIAERD